MSTAPGALQTGLSGSLLRLQSDKLDVCVLWEPVLWGSEEWDSAELSSLPKERAQVMSETDFM